MIFDERQATSARPDLDTDRLALCERQVLRGQPGVGKGFARSGQRQRDRARNVLAIFRA